MCLAPKSAMMKDLYAEGHYLAWTICFLTSPIWMPLLFIAGIVIAIGFIVAFQDMRELKR